MSLVFNLADSSGNSSESEGCGGLSLENALIHINAPLGSNAEFAKGGVTVRTVLSSQAFPNADGTTADYYYSIASANYGSWTVTATLGTDTVSRTIAIDSNKQYDLELSYDFYLFKSGLGAIVQFSTNNRSQVATTITSDYIDTVCSNSTQQGSLYTANAIDLTDYAALHYSIHCTYEPVDNVNYGLRMHVTSNQPVADTSNPAAIAKREFNVNSAFTEYIIDVSSISGSYYIGIWGAGSYKCNNIWLTM